MEVFYETIKKNCKRLTQKRELLFKKKKKDTEKQDCQNTFILAVIMHFFAAASLRTFLKLCMALFSEEKSTEL